MTLDEIYAALDVKRDQKEALIVEIKDLTQQKKELEAADMARKLAEQLTPEQRAAIIQVLG